MAMTPEILAARAEINDAVLNFAAAIDARDWDLLRSVLTDPFYLDYTSNGWLRGEIPVQTWVDRLMSLYGFDATLHMVSNLVIQVDGDAATCTSYVNAMHFLKEGEREYGAHACGVYRQELVRQPGGWRISSHTLQIAGRQSGEAAFAEAFARARELAPGRRPQGDALGG